jgi:hypothetical protein
MIKYLFIPFVFFLFSCGQNHVENLMLEQPTSKEEIIKYEKELGSTFHTTTYNGTPPKQSLNDSIVYEASLMFVNEKATPLPLKSKYYYDEKGEFKVIFHEWNLATPGLSIEKVDSLMATQDGKVDLYYNQFVKIANQITDRIGQPTGGDASLKREKMEIMDFYKSYVEWNQEDRYVVLKLYWVPKPGYKIYKIFTTVYFK